jgi:glycosyltransferase involved in cell wall biosynthesis
MDVPALLNQLDVFVLSSVMEANPVSILEAMASGKPVVSTAVGSIAETVLHEETGYLARAGDAAELASYTRRLLENKDLARRFGQAGRELLVENCSVHRMVRGYEQLIESLYQSKRPERTKLLPATTQA